MHPGYGVNKPRVYTEPRVTVIVWTPRKIMTDCSINLVRGLYQNPTWPPTVVIKCLFQTFVPFTIKSVTVWSLKNIICLKGKGLQRLSLKSEGGGWRD